MIKDLGEIFKCNPVISIDCPVGRSPYAPQFYNLGDFIFTILNITITISIFLSFFWLVWAAFQYIASSGDKNKLAQARARITWAIVGLVIILIAFLISQWAQQIIQPRGGTPII